MNPDSEFVTTKSALLKKGSVDGFECVVYESYKSRKTKSEEKDSESTKRIGRRDFDDFDVKKVTHEVVKFGIGGMKPEEKRQAKEALLLKLRAKPPKNVGLNYKEFLEKRQVESEKLKYLERTQPDNPMLNLLNNQKKKKKRQTLAEKRKNNILEAYGKPGQVGIRKKRRKK